MAGKMISELSDAITLQNTDLIPLARGASTLRIAGSAIATQTNLLTLSANPFVAADTSTIDLNLTNRTLSASVIDSSITNSKLAFDGGSFAFRNKIINGSFDVWQRGTSLTSGSGARYLADRWTNGSAGTTYTASRQSFTLGQTNVPGEPEYFHRSVVTSVAGASNNATLHQHIESVRTLAGKTATLSFYAKADAAKNIAVEFYRYFGTGGSPSTSVSFGVTTCALTTSWQKFTVTVNIPSIAGKTIGTDRNDYLTVYFWLDAGSNNNSRTNSLGQQSGTFDFAEVQFEEGSVATPFEERPIGTELALCQRYYERGVGFYGYSITETGGGTGLSGGLTSTVTFRNIKRVNPVMTQTFTAGSGGYSTTIFSIWVPNIYGAQFNLTNSSNADVGGSISWAADAEF